MDMTITFPAGKRVDASFRDFTVKTDQPEKADGDNSAPTPFELFLASMGTCVGIFVLSFCRQRKIPTDGITIQQKNEANPKTHMIENVEFEIKLPEDFPERYTDAVIRAAEQCAVKRHLADPPSFTINTATG